MKVESTRVHAHIHADKRCTERADAAQKLVVDRDRFERSAARFECEWTRVSTNLPGERGVEHACLSDYGKLIDQLAEMRAGYAQWRTENPNAREPTDGCRSLGDILNDPTLTSDQMCVHIIEVIIHERPETADEIRASIPAHELESVSGGPPPNTEISRGIFSAFGGLASLVGGFLQSPFAVPLLTAACAAIPGAQVLIPFLPVLAPVAGAALNGLGGMAGQVGQGEAPTLDAASLASGAAGAVSPDALASVLGGLL
jgi:hypothetical protein